MRLSKRRRYRYLGVLAAVIAGYLVISYLVLPATWSRT
jgi:hypothetical protein